MIFLFNVVYSLLFFFLAGSIFVFDFANQINSEMLKDPDYNKNASEKDKKITEKLKANTNRWKWIIWFTYLVSLVFLYIINNGNRSIFLLPLVLLPVAIIVLLIPKTRNLLTGLILKIIFRRKIAKKL